MINDILIWGFGLLGIVSLLMCFVFKMITWKLDDFTITVPLSYGDEDIINKVYNIRSFLEFCGIDDKCTVVLIDYGAPKWVRDKITDYYEKYNFLKIVDADTKVGEL